MRRARPFRWGLSLFFGGLPFGSGALFVRAWPAPHVHGQVRVGAMAVTASTVAGHVSWQDGRRRTLRLRTLWGVPS